MKVKWTIITLLISEAGFEVIDPTTQTNALIACLLINETPPNSLRDANVGFRTKQRKKIIWGTFPNSQCFESRRVCLNYRMGIGRTYKQEFMMK